MKCWGYGQYGQLGQGASMRSSFVEFVEFKLKPENPINKKSFDIIQTGFSSTSISISSTEVMSSLDVVGGTQEDLGDEAFEMGENLAGAIG